MAQGPPFSRGQKELNKTLYQIDSFDKRETQSYVKKETNISPDIPWLVNRFQNIRESLIFQSPAQKRLGYNCG